MDKYTKLFLAAILIVAVGLGSTWLILRTRRPQVVETPLFPENPQKGQFGYEETDTKVEIGSEGTAKATFDRVEAGNIYINEGGSLRNYPLILDEVVLACTTQNLEEALELDYDAITKVIVAKPDEIGGKIPQGEPVVVFSQDIEGVVRVHTIAMSADKCPLK